MNILIPCIIVAYLLGSLSSAVIVCHWLGLPDPRAQGSGNPGATNVLRIGSKKAAILTLLGDAAKGFVAVMGARALGVENTALALVGLSAFLGHLFPIFFRFRGGKGVATGFGVTLGLSWPVALLLLVTWALVVAIFRYSSLGAIIAVLLLPAYALLFSNPYYVFPLSILALLTLFCHRHNIQRLIQGTEGKLGQGNKKS